MKIGIIREGKLPADKRTPLTPEHCLHLMQRFPALEIVAQTSAIRCFSDEEYAALGIAVVEDISDCGLILGIKEVPKDMLVPGSTMMFFSHTIKKQPHNRKLLQAVVDRNIRLIDYECLTDSIGRRLLGFGRYAGIVGSYNALTAYGKRNGTFQLNPANQCSGIAEMHSELKKVRLGNERIIVSGGGKVAHGVRETLTAAGIAEVSIPEFLSTEFAYPVWCNADILDYHELDGNPPESIEAFIRNSTAYTNTFKKFLPKSDIYISAHFWDGRSTPFFTQEDVKADDFRPRVIADITCDIQGSVPTTLRSSTIESPIYGYDRFNATEVGPFAKDSITIMAVDNLPCEIPADASKGFGADLATHIIPLFLDGDSEQVLERATICQDGKLTRYFSYLQDYLDGKV
ncbi:MAG: NAD(P)-dependent oxidoreductase [Flavobacteriales bacterium]|nr:NAD(P)-dependent oxidoreductase [Flavobacteriales bacterium]